MRSDYAQPINLGTSRLITINELVDLVSEIGGKQLRKRHNLAGPQGVRGRNSDNTRLLAVTGWEPGISLEEGLTETYRWICAEVGVGASARVHS
jgi:nucleoside-diphosphate-sugar epimerase